jgi:hypothetical protein
MNVTADLARAAEALADAWHRRAGGPFAVRAFHRFREDISPDAGLQTIPVYSVDVMDGFRTDDVRAAVIAAVESLRQLNG